jgi:raffinose/stachyose/melibiose transport system substrate-binding protein
MRNSSLPSASRRDVLRFAVASALLPVAGARAADRTVLRLAHEENAPGSVQLLNETVASFEHGHPGIHVNQLYLENAAYKAKLTTMLQSEDRPDVLFSWGRGTLDAQVGAGVLREVTAPVNGWHESFNPTALDAFTVNGKLWGAPYLISGVGLFLNKPMLQRAGVTPDQLHDFDGLLKAVDRFKAAGIVPLTVGGGEKWPLHFYWAMLALRLGGKPAFDNALAGKDGGFSAPPFVEAGRMLQQLAKAGAFQRGFAGSLAPESYGQFGDGKAAMILMGNWLVAVQKSNAANGVGVSDADLGYAPFPLVAGGKGLPTDTFGGVNGWAVTKSAPDSALELLHALAGPDIEQKGAERNVFLPALKGYSDRLTNPVLHQVANELDHSSFHLLFLDQTLGPSVGSVVNDVSLALATGNVTPQAAAKQIEDARQAEQL